mmetsp:Transcript_50518/g.117810  ORF Transcript_50518/g.117810 Transcript_50518/m.117810 type:complete len:243 (+) Transcript_50518:1332-2060(+)
MEVGILQAELRLDEVLAFNVLLDDFNEPGHGLQILVPPERHPVAKMLPGGFRGAGSLVQPPQCPEPDRGQPVAEGHTLGQQGLLQIHEERWRRLRRRRRRLVLFGILRLGFGLALRLGLCLRVLLLLLLRHAGFESRRPEIIQLPDSLVCLTHQVPKERELPAPSSRLLFHPSAELHRSLLLRAQDRLLWLVLVFRLLLGLGLLLWIWHSLWLLGLEHVNLRWRLVLLRQAQVHGAVVEVRQ